MKTAPARTLGSLELTPIAPDTLAQFQATFKERTLPKLREDARRNARNVAVARQKTAY